MAFPIELKSTFIIHVHQAWVAVQTIQSRTESYGIHKRFGCSCIAQSQVAFCLHEQDIRVSIDREIIGGATTIHGACGIKFQVSHTCLRGGTWIVQGSHLQTIIDATWLFAINKLATSNIVLVIGQKEVRRNNGTIPSAVPKQGLGVRTVQRAYAINIT